MQRITILSFMIGSFAVAAVPALARGDDEAARAFAAGQALLAKVDFDGALEAFKAAAQADTKSQEYAQQFAMLRQVIRMRRDCPKERDAEQWLKMAGALRTFYHDHHLYLEALPLDKECHRRSPSTESAVLLAETQLALGLHSQNVDLLSGLTRKQVSPRTKVLHGLALAHLGQIDKAKKLTKRLRVSDDVVPRYFYDLARLRAVVGKPKGAINALTRSFELTPPSRLDTFKTEVKACEDFRGILDRTDFANALATPSKVKESGCSQGSGCGKCPSRAKCGKKASDGDKKKP